MAKGKNNRLSREASPYLLQHADNPVDWYPWSQEAFEEAKRLDRPVFLSIGYSTCHWCHVMEKESFENEHIAELMNSNFINIKVDREQYPDVDDVYMNAVQMMTGSGGWPLSVFLTPDKLPFFGGTYFPPSDTLNMPGFEKVLLTIADAWEKRQDELIDSASYITKSIKRHTPSQVEGKPTEAMIQKAYNFFRTNFDLQNGGFGGAPKFPQPLVLDFILNYYYRSGDEYALRMVTETLDTIADSGIHDHIGGGFHRYATDKNWLIPHFEKMLYDQAQLANVYLHAYQITGKDKYKRVVDKILKYVSRDMQNSEGGFYSAEDADSDGKEGGFYVWRPEEFDECLQEQSEILKNYYNVFEEGNFEDATSVLNVNESDSFFASRSGKDEKQFRQYVDRADAKLMAWRNQRTRPMRDEKIIVSWNALMISAFANAARILSEPEYADISEKSAGFILDRLFKDNSLARFCKKDKIVGQGYLEDYAFLGAALIDLYESTKEIKWLKTSLQLVDLMIDKFHSEGSGLFHHSSQRTDKVLDDKPLYDHATSSGNSAAVSLLIKTYLLTGDRKYYQLAENILIESYSVLTNMPQASAGMLMASDLYLGPAREVVIVAKAINGEVNEFQEIINKTYLPDTVILYNVPEGIIADYSPQFAGHVCRDNKVTAYVCSGFVCEKPVTDKDNFEQLLKPLKRNL